MPAKGKRTSGLLTQQKMLRGAVSLFLEKGYEGTTTAEIARAAGMTPSSFFRAYPSKEALLLELVRRMFSGQFALAQQHSGPTDPVVLYAVETAIQLHIAELSEPLRDLYVTGYSLPTTSAYIYHSTAKRLQVIFGPYLPQLQAKDFYEMELASAGMMRSFMSVPCDLYFTIEAKISRLLRPDPVPCAPKAAGGDHPLRAAAEPAHHGRGHHPEHRNAGRTGLCPAARTGPRYT